MKHAAAFLFGIATLQGAVSYDRDPVGVNGRGLGYFELFDGLPIDQSWMLAFGGGDGFVSVSVSAVGTYGSLGAAVDLFSPGLVGSRGRIWDTNGNNYEGLAAYELGTLPQTAKMLTIYDESTYNWINPGSSIPLASVPIWGHYAANLLESIPHDGRYETRRYEILIHTPEPAAWQLCAVAGLMFPVIRRYVIQRRIAVLHRQRPV